MMRNDHILSDGALASNLLKALDNVFQAGELRRANDLNPYVVEWEAKGGS